MPMVSINSVHEQVSVSVHGGAVGNRGKVGAWDGMKCVGVLVMGVALKA